ADEAWGEAALGHGLADTRFCRERTAQLANRVSSLLGPSPQPTNREPRRALQSDDTEASSEMPLALLRPDFSSDAAPGSYLNSRQSQPVNGYGCPAAVYEPDSPITNCPAVNRKPQRSPAPAAELRNGAAQSRRESHGPIGASTPRADAAAGSRGCLRR